MSDAPQILYLPHCAWILPPGKHTTSIPQLDKKKPQTTTPDELPLPQSKQSKKVKSVFTKLFTAVVCCFLVVFWALL